MLYNIKKYFILCMLILLSISFFKISVNAATNTKKIEKYNLLDDDCEGIVVNSAGEIYIGNMEKEEVDVYSNNGTYLHSLPSNTYGYFHIDIDDNDNIMIGPAREDKLLVFNKYGKLVSSQDYIDVYHVIGDKNDTEFKDNNGNTYTLERHVLFGRTKVTKTADNGTKVTVMIVPFNEYLKRIIKVIVITIIFCIGMFILIKVKIINQKTSR